MVDFYYPCNLVGMTRFERATSRPPDGEWRVKVRGLHEGARN